MLDKGKQTKGVHTLERVRPLRISETRICFNGEGAVEVGSGSSVPGMTGQGACAETVHVVEKVVDDDLDELKGKPCGRGRACHRGLQESAP